MKKLFLAVICLSLFCGIAMASNPSKNPYDLQVKKLYSAPDENSNLVYDIPLEVRLLDMSADTNWYKVKISFKLGPFNYTYVGWAQIPIGDIMAEREKASKLAKAPAPEEELPAESPPVE